MDFSCFIRFFCIFASYLKFIVMYYIKIFNGNYWTPVFKFMCRSIACYYSHIIHKQDNCLTRVVHSTLS